MTGPEAAEFAAHVDVVTPTQFPPVQDQLVAAGAQLAVSVIGMLVVPVVGPVTVHEGGVFTMHATVRAPATPPSEKSLQFGSVSVRVAAPAGAAAPNRAAAPIAASSVRKNDFVMGLAPGDLRAGRPSIRSKIHTIIAQRSFD